MNNKEQAVITMAENKGYIKIIPKNNEKNAVLLKNINGKISLEKPIKRNNKKD